MKLTRRAFVGAGGAATAALGAGYAGKGAAAPALVIYDSRLPRSVAFAQAFDAQRLDVASQDATRWRNLRSALPSGPLVGLTRWSDYVLVRGFVEDQRKRLRREWRSGDLLGWELS